MADEPDDASEFVDWEPKESPSTPPPPASLSWLEQQVGGRIGEVEALVGGLSSAVHRVTLTTGDRVVLRRFTIADWMEREPHIPFDEARTLDLLRNLDVGVATPTLIAADPDATHCDVPAIVMTEVAGRPMIDTHDWHGYAERLAACLAAINEIEPVGGLGEYQRWDQPKRPIPTWTHVPDLWHEAIALGATDLPTHPHRFLHRDFHPNNIHWDAGEICGVVDWLSACNGPIAGDLAHCRWNLAILAEPAIAEHFTAQYRSLTGYSEDTHAFDLATALSGPVGPFPTFAWNDLGRTDLTSDVVGQRFDGWLAHLLA